MSNSELNVLRRLNSEKADEYRNEIRLLHGKIERLESAEAALKAIDKLWTYNDDSDMAGRTFQDVIAENEPLLRDALAKMAAWKALGS